MAAQNKGHGIENLRRRRSVYVGLATGRDRRRRFFSAVENTMPEVSAFTLHRWVSIIHAVIYQRPAPLTTEGEESADRRGALRVVAKEIEAAIAAANADDPPQDVVV